MEIKPQFDYSKATGNIINKNNTNYNNSSSTNKQQLSNNNTNNCNKTATSNQPQYQISNLKKAFQEEKEKLINNNQYNFKKIDNASIPNNNKQNTLFNTISEKQENQTSRDISPNMKHILNDLSHDYSPIYTLSNNNIAKTLSSYNNNNVNSILNDNKYRINSIENNKDPCESKATNYNNNNKNSNSENVRYNSNLNTFGNNNFATSDLAINSSNSNNVNNVNNNNNNYGINNTFGNDQIPQKNNILNYYNNKNIDNNIDTIKEKYSSINNNVIPQGLEQFYSKNINNNNNITYTKTEENEYNNIINSTLPNKKSCIKEEININNKNKNKNNINNRHQPTINQGNYNPNLENVQNINPTADNLISFPFNLNTTTDEINSTYLDQLLSSPIEWKNVNDVVRVTIKSLHELIKSQQLSIKELEKQLSQKASKYELNSGLSIKASSAEVTLKYKDLNNSLENKLSIDQFNLAIQDKITKQDLKDTTVFLKNNLSNQVLSSIKDNLINELEMKMKKNNERVLDKVMSLNEESSNNIMNNNVNKYVSFKDFQTLSDLINSKADVIAVNEALDFKVNNDVFDYELKNKVNEIDVENIIKKYYDNEDDNENDNDNKTNKLRSTNSKNIAHINEELSIIKNQINDKCFDSKEDKIKFIGSVVHWNNKSEDIEKKLNEMDNINKAFEEISSNQNNKEKKQLDNNNNNNNLDNSGNINNTSDIFKKPSFKSNLEKCIHNITQITNTRLNSFEQDLDKLINKFKTEFEILSNKSKSTEMKLETTAYNQEDLFTKLSLLENRLNTSIYPTIKELETQQISNQETTLKTNHNNSLITNINERIASLTNQINNTNETISQIKKIKDRENREHIDKALSNIKNTIQAQEHTLKDLLYNQDKLSSSNSFLEQQTNIIKKQIEEELPLIINNTIATELHDISRKQNQEILRLSETAEKTITEINVLKNNIDILTQEKLNKQDFEYFLENDWSILTNEKLTITHIEKVYKNIMNDVSEKTKDYYSNLKEEVFNIKLELENSLPNKLETKVNINDFKDFSLQLQAIRDSVSSITTKITSMSFSLNELNESREKNDAELKSLVNDVNELVFSLDKKSSELKQEISEETASAIHNEICILNKETSEIVLRLNNKADIDDVNKALTSIHDELDLKSNVDETNKRLDRLMLSSNCLLNENNILRMIWKKSSNTNTNKNGHLINWELLKVNTNPDNYFVDREKQVVSVSESGVYELLVCFFTNENSRKPSFQVLVNNEPILCSINYDEYNLFNMKNTYEVNSAVSNTNIRIFEYVVLKEKSKLSIAFNGDAMYGVFSIKKID